MSTQTVTEIAADVPTLLFTSVHNAVIESFDKICYPNSSCEAQTNLEVSCDGVVGIISFIGDVNCTLILGLPHESAEVLAKKFTGFEVPMDSPDMGDVIGELANVLAGNVNGMFERAGFKTQISLPTIARGHDVEMLLPHQLPTQKMFFSAIGAGFWVKLVVAQPH